MHLAIRRTIRLSEGFPSLIFRRTFAEMPGFWKPAGRHGVKLLLAGFNELQHAGLFHHLHAETLGNVTVKSEHRAVMTIDGKLQLEAFLAAIELLQLMHKQGFGSAVAPGLWQNTELMQEISSGYRNDRTPRDNLAIQLGDGARLEIKLRINPRDVGAMRCQKRLAAPHDTDNRGDIDGSGRPYLNF